MSDDLLFDVPETPSPDRQWKDLAKAAGVLTYPTDDGICATLEGYRATGETEFDAIHKLYAGIVAATGREPIFPTFHQWRLTQIKK